MEPISSLHQWVERSELFHNVVVGAAAFAGGWWALSRYRRERTDEAALDVLITHKTAPHGEGYVVFMLVELTNKGKTKLQAKVERCGGFAFDDGAEKLLHSCGVQIRQIDNWKPEYPRHLDWFESPMLKMVDSLPPELNLLTEYEDPKNNNRVDFWMEPGETYHLGGTFVLPVGIYLAKVTFIGEGSDENFWSRVHCLNVPASLSVG